MAIRGSLLRSDVLSRVLTLQLNAYSTVSHGREVTPDAMQENGSDRDEREDTETVQAPYSQSGTFEKRRRMKELVSQREHKRLRRY